MNRATIVQKLWNYCNILRGDGLSCIDYVEQRTLLVCLKRADEQNGQPLRAIGAQLLP
jgi:type I restriction enzyme M protein